MTKKDSAIMTVIFYAFLGVMGIAWGMGGMLTITGAYHSHVMDLIAAIIIYFLMTVGGIYSFVRARKLSKELKDKNSTQ